MLWLAIIFTFITSVVSITFTIPQDIELRRRVNIGWRRTNLEPAEFALQLRTIEGAVGRPIEIGRPTNGPPSITVTAENPEPTPRIIEGIYTVVFPEPGTFILEAIDSMSRVLGSSTIFQVHDGDDVGSRPGVGPEPSATETFTTIVPRPSSSHVISKFGSSSRTASESSSVSPSTSPSHRPSSSSIVHSSTPENSFRPSKTRSLNILTTNTFSASTLSIGTPSPSSSSTSSITEAPTTATDSLGARRRNTNIAMVVGLVIGGVALVFLIRWLSIWFWRRSPCAAIHSTPHRALQYYVSQTFTRRPSLDPTPTCPPSIDAHAPCSESKERFYLEHSSHPAATSSSSTLAVTDTDPDPIRRRIAELEQANVQQSNEMAQLMVENELWRGQHHGDLGFGVQEHLPPHYDGTSTQRFTRSVHG